MIQDQTANLKIAITSRFKEELLNQGSIVLKTDEDYLCVDEYIRPFLKELNKNPHIQTMFSCEGHCANDNAMIFFNVNERGWDVFWLQVMPELSDKFCYTRDITGEMLHQVLWGTSVKGNRYNAGINIFTYLEASNYSTWEESKLRFWQTLQEVFLKHFPNK